MLREACDHWSVAVLTVTVHSSFFPTFDFFFLKCVAFCAGFNLLAPIFMLPYIMVDLPVFEQNSVFFINKVIPVIHLDFGRGHGDGWSDLDVNSVVLITLYSCGRYIKWYIISIQ